MKSIKACGPAALTLFLAFFNTSQTQAAGDPSTVLVLVNDAWPAEAGTGGLGASIYVGGHYAAVRHIPAGNVLHLNIPLDALQYAPTYDFITYLNYKTYIETPVQNYLNLTGLAGKILYIVPTYGIPYMLSTPIPGDRENNERVCVDSVLAGMNSRRAGVRLFNPYHATGPLDYQIHFENWANPSGWKMYLVTRLDGPSAPIAAALADKAVAAETSLQTTDGTGYYDWQHIRDPKHGYYYTDQTMLKAYRESVAFGVPGVLNDQSVTQTQFSPASGYFYSGSAAAVYTRGASTLTARFSFPATDGGSFRTTYQNVGEIYNGVGYAWYRLYSADRQSYWEMFYPVTDWWVLPATLTKVSNGRIAATCQAAVPASPQANNVSFTFGDSQGQVLADGAPLCTLTDPGSTPVTVSQGEIVYKNFALDLTGLYVQDASANFLWNDAFATDPATRYTWLTTPKQAPNALFIWGWYSAVVDAYAVVNGSVGAQMTSYTANFIRSNGIPRQDAQWVPYFLRLGITATWGATGEPYTIGYANGDNLLGHFWQGFNFAESAYIANPLLNWMMVFIGDPLYAPAVFQKNMPPPPPPSSSTTVTVNAWGTPDGGVYPVMQLSDASTGNILQTWTVTDEPADYTYTTYIPVTNNLRVSFINDAYDAPDDRNLYVSSLSLNGSLIFSTDPRVYATGGWNGKNCENGHAEDNALFCNGYFEFPTATGGSVTVNAWGTPAAGIYPVMRLIDSATGNVLQSWSVTGEAADYTWTDTGPIASNLRVAFANDAYDPPEDRNLIVNSLSVNGNLIPATDPRVYGTGAWNGARCESGFLRVNGLFCSGYFEFPTASVPEGVP